MKRIWLSFSSSFGVVPDEISAWNPDSAPHAMVMNRNGNSEPANTGPSPLVANREIAGACNDRVRDADADRQQGDGADLHERRQVVARREQQPHRQHRRHEAVDDDQPRHRRPADRFNQDAPQDVSATQLPEATASSSSTKPITDTSATRPGRRNRR